MRLRTKVGAGGKMRQVRVHIDDDIWKKVKPSDLETEGKGGNIDGYVQEKTGQVQMNVAPVHETALVVRPAAGPLMLIDLK